MTKEKEPQKVNSQETNMGENIEMESIDSNLNLSGDKNESSTSSNEAQQQPDDLNKEIKPEELLNKLEQMNDKYLRLAAEFDNYRRRTLKEKQDLILNGGEDVIKSLLTIIDDFERAIKLLKETSQENEAVIEGTELIYNKLITTLKARGLKPIEALNRELDTDFHEAIANVPVEDSSKKNLIIDVVQQGYTLNEKVIRYAKVVVGQ